MSDLIKRLRNELRDLFSEAADALEAANARIAALEAKLENPVAWLVKCKESGRVEQADPHEKASNPECWTDAFPVYSGVAPPDDKS